MSSPSMQPDPRKPAKPAHHPRLFGDPDPSMQPTLTWGTGSVTITNIPTNEGGPVSSVTINGVSATQQAGDGSTWAANVGSTETGNSMRVAYATLLYTNTNFPNSTTRPLLSRQG